MKRDFSLEQRMTVVHGILCLVLILVVRLMGKRQIGEMEPAEFVVTMLIANLAAGYSVDYGVLMLGVLFCSIPTMIIFFILQKQFAEGITGAVK